MIFSNDFCGFLEEKFDEDSEDEYEDIDDKVNDMEIDGKSELIEKEDDIFILNKIIWNKMFDYVMDPIMIEIQKSLYNDKMNGCKYLCLVGGLPSSPYFEDKIETEFGSKSKYKLQIIVPSRPILSVVAGAAYFGITTNYIKQRFRNI